MSTELFTRKDFEDVLRNFCKDNEVTLKERGIVVGEYRYHVIAKTVKVPSMKSASVSATGAVDIVVEIASSIGHSGVADGTGENSIRLWLSGGDGLPLGSKISRWVTRVKGWENRMTDQIGRLLDMGSSLEWCTKCNSMEKIFIVKKEGKNKGRLFIKCNCENSFSWLSEVDQEAPVAKPVSKSEAQLDKVIKERLEEKAAFAEREAIQERKAFASDPDYCRAVSEVAVPSVADVKSLIKNVREERKVVESATAAAPLPGSLTPSKRQAAIFDWIVKTNDTRVKRNLAVSAVAGSGKTTTGIDILRYLPPNCQAVFIAFGKRIATHLSKKLEPFGLKNVKVSTCHSLGFSACRRAWGSQFDENDTKMPGLIWEHINKETHGYLFSTVKQLVELVKCNLMEPTVENMSYLADHHGILLNGDEELVFMAVASIIEKSKSLTKIIDYTDMCWLPVIHKVSCWKYDFVFIDEAQDISKDQCELAKMSVKWNGRIVAVGDEFQSMFGFRGADIDAIQNLIRDLSAEILPLDITYRCPKSHVRMINAEFPEIPFEAAPWAIEGSIRHITEAQAETEYATGDLVICRTNAPLVSPAFALIRRGIKANIVGRDIGRGLTSLIKKMKVREISSLLMKLAEYREKESAKLVAANKTAQVQSLNDKIETIFALCDGIEDIDSLYNKISDIFADDVEGVAFSSVHRAKGLEAERVYILHSELMPHPMAKQEWEYVQERHIRYVALSRSKNDMIFVH